MEARLIKVCGEVQHVGFRRFIWSHSKRLGLRGYVRNLPDGCVEVLAVGERQQLEALLRKVSAARAFEVTSVEVKDVEVREEYLDFEIR